MRRKNEGLKKPTGMRLVPLGGTGVRAGLNHLVFCTERGGQRLSLLATRGVSVCQSWRGPLRRGAKAQNRLERCHVSFPGKNRQAGAAILLRAAKNCTTPLVY